jgi:putative FmdB family regulatory protein
MPTYEYACAKCGETIDVSQSIKAKHLVTCPENACARKRWGKGKVKRLIGTGGGIIFKGGGFYETDYRSESYKSGEKKAKEAKESAKKKPEEKSKGSKKEKPSSKPSKKKE